MAERGQEDDRGDRHQEEEQAAGGGVKQLAPPEPAGEAGQVEKAGDEGEEQDRSAERPRRPVPRHVQRPQRDEQAEATRGEGAQTVHAGIVAVRLAAAARRCTMPSVSSGSSPSLRPRTLRRDGRGRWAPVGAVALAAAALTAAGCRSGGGEGPPANAAAPEPAPAAASVAAAASPPPVSLVGSVEIPSGTEFAGTVVGGLSGLTYDPARELYYAISDDKVEHGPARFYTLRIDLGDGRLDDGDVTVMATTPLLDDDGKPFVRGSIDAEGIALAPAGGGAPEELFVSSEGEVRDGVPPFVRRFGLDGRPRASLSLPSHVLPSPGTGVRHNLALESLTVSPDGARLFTATENALVQDGPAADLGTGSPARILVYDVARPAPPAEYVYPVGPVPLAPRPPDGFRVNGLVELVALGRTELLALERAFSIGAGYTVRLYRVSLAGATDVAGRERLADAGSAVRPVTKTEVVDFADLLGPAGIALDNLEGMTFGPPLADGRRLLLVLADDNFSPLERTLILAVALPPAP